jgi:RHS repeat-associated protein
LPRISASDGNGTTQYAYVPVGALGALQLQQEQSPLSSSAITYAYDELGRLSSRTVAGSGAESFGYDAIGRLTSHASDLGAFTLSYLGQTSQITQRQLASSTLMTNWGYLPNSGDRRLASIDNTGLAAGQYSNYSFTTVPENLITGISETSDTATVYPAVLTQSATYNGLNQLTDLSGQALTYDLDGNLTSDGQRNYSWDAENRLVGISYPGQPGKQTAFAYDGLSRRTSIASTPTGGGTVTTSYVWCGTGICQARDAGNSVTRAYYAEGELIPGTPAQPYYYAPDQIGSVRRVFASTTSAPTYSYDPYGNALQGTAPVTDFGYAGMFYNGDSGLYLTQYRAYDPVTGRWLSRDPMGESSDPVGNLYPYVGSSPLVRVDPRGNFWPLAIGAAVILAYEFTPTPANAPGSCDSLESVNDLAPFINAGIAASIGALLGGTLGVAAPEIIGPKVASQMAARGWTREAIQEAVESGLQVRAINKATGNSATRYIHPTTGQSVVIDNTTGEVIHVGGPGFKYGPQSGDVP